jgi:hypothetical protein
VFGKIEVVMSKERMFYAQFINKTKMSGTKLKFDADYFLNGY